MVGGTCALIHAKHTSYEALSWVSTLKINRVASGINVCLQAGIYPERNPRFFSNVHENAGKMSTTAVDPRCSSLIL